MNNDKNDTYDTYTRKTRASKRARTTTTTTTDEDIAEEGAKQKSTVTKSKERSAVESTSTATSTSTPRKRTRMNIAETEPSSKQASHEDAPQDAKAPSDGQLQQERRAIGEPTVERTALPTGTATLNHPTHGRILAEWLKKDNSDEATLARAVRDINSDYLRKVLQILLRNHRNGREERKREILLGIVPEPPPTLEPCEARMFVIEVNTELRNKQNYPMTQIHVTDQSVVSEITDRNEYVEKYQRKCLSHHRLMECEEDVGYTIRESNGKSRTGTRRARGICRNCKRKTKWFCPTCPGTHGAKRAWFCHKRNNPVCQETHLEKMELAFDDEES